MGTANSLAARAGAPNRARGAHRGGRSARRAMAAGHLRGWPLSPGRRRPL